MISRRQGPSSPLIADTDGSTPAFFTHASAGATASRTWRKAPLGSHPRLGPHRWFFWAVTIRHDPAMMAHHPSAAAPPLGFLGGRRSRARPTRRIRAMSTDFDAPPILRRSKGPSSRDIVAAKDSPSSQFQWAICVHISELHQRWLKMGRTMRPLSAAPHQARCGQMCEEFREYTIERRLDRAIRSIDR